MLENEKNILFTIKHDNLIDLLYAFETKRYIVFGLEYCPNGNLYSYLQKVKNIPEPQARSVMVQILNGLDYLHANNILFRDIKLENILFDMDGKIKITDFGLSKPEVDEDEITYSYCGSPEYMAPEMLAKYSLFYLGPDIHTKLTSMPWAFCSMNFSLGGRPSMLPRRKISSTPFFTQNPSSRRTQSSPRKSSHSSRACSLKTPVTESVH